jgi:hypothetical protein
MKNHRIKIDKSFTMNKQHVYKSVTSFKKKKVLLESNTEQQYHRSETN